MMKSRILPLFPVVAASLVLASCSSSGGSVLGRGVDTLGGLTRPAGGAAQESNPGAEIDAQEAELRAQLEPKGAKVERAGDQLVVMIPSTLAFDANRDQVKRGAEPLVRDVATFMKKYSRTTVDVYGHTDAGGDEKKNLDLTQRRALAVARLLARNGVDAKRLSVTGFGSSRPLDPATAEQLQMQSPRIEIQINPAPKG